MENKTQIRKLYDIARAFRATDGYISYIESVAQGRLFNACELADEIYKAAMIKYEASIRKHASAIETNGNSMADQLDRVNAFAMKYGLLYDYAFYLERRLLESEKFNMLDALNKLTTAAICKYDIRLRSKIGESTGITIINGYRDAV